MYRRTYQSNREELVKSGKALLREDADNKFLYRVSMVQLILNGMSAHDLALYSGTPERTLISWVQKVDAEGWDSLMAIKQSGRPEKLSPAEKQEIAGILLQNPTEYGYRAWSGSALADYIKKTFNVDYNIRSCQLLMRQLTNVCQAS